MAPLTLDQLWHDAAFAPNTKQAAAIRHTNGPLYLPAGPGSGKTRVLLWRTLNLIVFHGVEPEEIYLSTFTEKAARQLKEGLRSLLSLATQHTGKPYDLSGMYIGTVHALCQQLLADRRFSHQRQRRRMPHLLDELDQFFYLNNRQRWQELTAAAGLDDNPEMAINALFAENGRAGESKFVAVSNCLQLFNRLSEECIDPLWAKEQVADKHLAALLEMYSGYLRSLSSNRPPQTDFSLLQQQAYMRLAESDVAGDVFKHVIIDEYQDTNTIQERIFFALAAGSKNLCVVGDDDQALYRFRGATVENFVDFPQRCRKQLGVDPRQITLDLNYRSHRTIVDFYTDFISRIDWRKNSPTGGHYRVIDKNIRAHDRSEQPAVVASTPAAPDAACAEIAHFVRRLIEARKVEDASQVAFLFPSLKSRQVQRMKQALEREGLPVYAPRAGRFLEVDEARLVFGLFSQIFGKLPKGDYGGRDYHDFHDWLDAIHQAGRAEMDIDSQLVHFVRQRRGEIELVSRDYAALGQVVAEHGWDLAAPYRSETMKRALYAAPGLSESARKAIASQHFEIIAAKRRREGKPFSLKYVIRRTTSLDWNVLDLFYQLCGFDRLKDAFDRAESGDDEAPVCNLSLVSKYLARFSERYASILTAESLCDGGFQRLFFGFYLFTLFRLGESEYEDSEDPFPRGRIPFITVHQSKGLEFPVVVLANPRKNDRQPQKIETLVQPLLERDGEPLDRMAQFDVMRMFYVALSRAENVLVIAHFKGRGQTMNAPFKQMLDGSFPRIPDFDISSLPEAPLAARGLPKNYSYTGDFLLYQKCPRQYMIFRKYGFAPSRSQTMMFGSLVHRTLDDLHQFLIAQRTGETNGETR